MELKTRPIHFPNRRTLAPQEFKLEGKKNNRNETRKQLERPSRIHRMYSRRQNISISETCIFKYTYLHIFTMPSSRQSLHIFTQSTVRFPVYSQYNHDVKFRVFHTLTLTAMPAAAAAAAFRPSDYNMSSHRHMNTVIPRHI